MKKNGFTMAELLGVITVLAIIVLLAIPAITKNITGGKQKLYQVQLENFKKAASSWMTSHTLELPEEVIDTSITLGCLKSEGLIENSVVNPLTGTEFPNDLTITIKSASNQFVYTVDENSGTDTSVPIPKGKCKFKNGLIDGVSNPTLVEVIKNADEIMTLDPDKNPRYVGRNPNNFVLFNNELWRIIGEFNGEVKIIRTYSNDSYTQWDATEGYGGHGENGSNDWSIATLQAELNGTYLNDINETSRNMIEKNHVWNLGGTTYSEDTWTRENMYNDERGNKATDRPTEWTGAIALPYISDYGYATSSNDTECSTMSMDNWNDASTTNCLNNSWMYTFSIPEEISFPTEWTLNVGDDQTNVYSILSHGTLDVELARFGRIYRPALYLKSNVKVTEGDGSETSPYELTY